MNSENESRDREPTDQELRPIVAILYAVENQRPLSEPPRIARGSVHNRLVRKAKLWWKVAGELIDRHREDESLSDQKRAKREERMEAERQRLRPFPKNKPRIDFRKLLLLLMGSGRKPEDRIVRFRRFAKFCRMCDRYAEHAPDSIAPDFGMRNPIDPEVFASIPVPDLDEVDCIMEGYRERTYSREDYEEFGISFRIWDDRYSHLLQKRKSQKGAQALAQKRATEEP